MRKLVFICTMLALVCTASAQNCWQYHLDAPGSMNGYTDGRGNNCSLMPSEDAIIQVTIPSAGRWSFSTCSGGGDYFNTHISIGTECCTSDICESAAGTSDNCGGTEAECHCISVHAGTYYVTVEGDFENDGDFFFQVTQCSDNCYDREMTAGGEPINGNTCNQGNDCDLASGEDVVVKVTIPNAGFWTFSTCGSGGAHDDYYPYLYVGHECCTADICSSTGSDYCDDGDAACPCLWLPAGDVYVTLDRAAGFCGEYRLSVMPGQDCGPAPDTTWVEIGAHFCLDLPQTIAWCCNLPGAPIFSWLPGCMYGLPACNDDCNPYTGAVHWGPISHLGYWNGCHWWATTFHGGPGCICVYFETQLSVELTSFAALPGNNEVALQWSTASETNNDHFEIQRATADDWEVIGEVRGQGTTSEGTDYRFADRNGVNGTTYRYRLAVVDVNGFKEFKGSIVSATPGASAGMPAAYALRQNYPNPFNPSTTIGFDLVEAGFVSLKVYNLMGQEVANLVSATMTAGAHALTFDASTLSSGVYLYRLEVNGFAAEQKMLLMK